MLQLLHRLGSRRLNRVTSRGFVSSSTVTCHCRCHRGWSARPPTHPACASQAKPGVELPILCPHHSTQHSLVGWLAACSLIVCSERRLPACCRQTCLLLFGSCANGRCNIPDVRVSFNASGQPNRNAPGRGSSPARVNINTKHPNPATGATWDDDFIRNY